MELTTPTALAQMGPLAVHYGLSLAGAVLLLLGGWFLAGMFSRWAYRSLSRINGVDETLARFFKNALHYVLLMLVFVMVLGQFGVQTASILAALGAAGLAVGLALQGTLQNIAAGIMLLVLRPFRIGEYIESATVQGKIVQIGLFATEMRTLDGLYLLAPNSTLWNTPIVNHSREPERRAQIDVSIANDADVRTVKQVLTNVVSSDRRLSQDPPPQVYLDDLTADKTVLKLEYWARTGEWTSVRNDLIEAIKASLAEKGIAVK